MKCTFYVAHKPFPEQISGSPSTSLPPVALLELIRTAFPLGPPVRASASALSHHVRRLKDILEETPRRSGFYELLSSNGSSTFFPFQPTSFSLMLNTDAFMATGVLSVTALWETKRSVFVVLC